MIQQIGSGLIRLTLVLCCCVGWNAALAELRVTVDRTEITDADLLKLTIRIDNTTASTNPDFRALEQDFEIMQRSGPNQSSRISIINGRQTSEVYTTWELRLRPKRLGGLNIPAFQLGNDRSRPIQIQVNQQSEAMKRKMSQLVFFETSVDTNETYVQGQVLYTVKLYYVENISGDFPAPPALPDVVVETVENERRYDAITNGRRYYVLEKRYGIYPQKSGAITIPAQTFSGYRVGPGFFSTREPVLSRSEPHRIDVKPKPANFAGDHWLPATELTLTAEWLGGNPEFTVGEPVNRSIQLEAKGLASSLLPELQIDNIPGAKAYQDPAEEEQTVNAEGISAKQTVVVGIVPTEPGTLELPEIRIPWWNTAADRLEEAVIPGETFRVAPSPTAAVNVPAAAPNIEPSTEIEAAQSSGVNAFWQQLAIALTVLWVLTLIAWFVHSRRSKPVAEQQSKVVESKSEQEALRQLTKACQSNDGIKVVNYLVEWGSFRYGKVRSVQELATRSQSPELQQAIAELENALYAADAAGAWQGQQMLKAIQSLSKQSRGGQLKTNLAALNPA